MDHRRRREIRRGVHFVSRVGRGELMTDLATIRGNQAIRSSRLGRADTVRAHGPLSITRCRIRSPALPRPNSQAIRAKLMRRLVGLGGEPQRPKTVPPEPDIRESMQPSMRATRAIRSPMTDRSAPSRAPLLRYGRAEFQELPVDDIKEFASVARGSVVGSPDRVPRH
jgi:hypothetical protein